MKGLKINKRAISGLQTIAIVCIVLIAAVASVTYLWASRMKGRKTLVISTTTSLYDTGLLDAIEDQFESKHPIDILFISAGTGLAIKNAQRGDADMILVHDPSKELTFLKGGYGVCRKIIAYNFFTIVGPENDPAEIEGLSPTQALTKIVEAGRNGDAVWASRGDDSGTHTKEKGLWAAADYDWTNIREEEWYMEAGEGMGKTLQIANEFSAYTLADMGTYLKYYKDGLISLVVLVDQGKELLNVYSSIAVSQALFSHLNFEGAINFTKFLISEECQQTISEYGKTQYGQSLFNPAVKLLKENTDPTLVSWIQEYAYFNGTECPPQYRDAHQELYD